MPKDVSGKLGILDKLQGTTTKKLVAPVITTALTHRGNFCVKAAGINGFVMWNHSRYYKLPKSMARRFEELHDIVRDEISEKLNMLERAVSLVTDLRRLPGFSELIWSSNQLFYRTHIICKVPIVGGNSLVFDIRVRDRALTDYMTDYNPSVRLNGFDDLKSLSDFAFRNQ